MTRCRLPKAKKPETWTELVDSGIDEYEVAIALLAASKEHMEDQEREMEELKRRVATYRLALLAVAHLK